MQSKQKVHVITMGCAKNLVDSEKLMAQLRLNNIEITHDIEDADVAVINTCGFIDAAKEESIEMILANVQRKGMGKLKKVYALGCLTDRYMIELKKEIPEVDQFFGSSNNLAGVLAALGAEYKYELLGERVLTTPPHYAFLKISEGCDNPCSFCAIPIMRGKHVSRTVEDIVQEAKGLAERGVKELVVIGQDTTYYGLDVYGERRLPALLEQLADLPGIAWVRLMYAYPATFPRELLKVIAEHPHICKYLDMPVQHINDDVLKSMRRGITSRALRQLLDELREAIPGVALRTTLIVGYPTETTQAFDELLRFVEEVTFERLGVFAYSREEGTTAYPLGDPVPLKEKERRKALVMTLQREISTAYNRTLVGTTQRVLVDGRDGNVYVGRTERDAPEIDNAVLIAGDNPLPVGEFLDVAIERASEYDVFGSPIMSHGHTRDHHP
ncbi:MAG: 30S ribosomal protein S12 methylthiotransferase RimO [Ignavibacteria bacterium]